MHHALCCSENNPVFLWLWRKYKLILLHSIYAPGYIEICSSDTVRGILLCEILYKSLPAEGEDVQGSYSENSNSLILVFKRLEKRVEL